MSGYLAAMDSFPLPGTAPASVVAPAPGRGTQFWTGAPPSSAAPPRRAREPRFGPGARWAVFDDDGAIVLGYRVRNGPDTTDETVVARSTDGGATSATGFSLGQDHFGAQWH